MDVDDVIFDSPRGSTAKNLIILHTPVVESESEWRGPYRMPGPSSSGGRVNPFERYNLDNLQYPFWSPSVFDNVSSQGTSTSPRRMDEWDVDQMARLFPKQIEESPSSHMNAYPINPAMEAKAQSDIDKFFNSGPIAPSPDVNIYGMKGLLVAAKQMSMVSKRSDTTTTANSWTMTELSLPPILPTHVQDALAPYFTVVCESETEILPVPVEEQIANLAIANTSGIPSSAGDGRLNTSINSVRRRLELSFGEMPLGIKLVESLPLRDPFSSNHVVASPEHTATDSDFEDSTSDLEVYFKRCEFTPEEMLLRCAVSPEITPIRNDDATPKTPFSSNNSRSLSYSSTPTGRNSSSTKKISRRRKFRDSDTENIPVQNPNTSWKKPRI